MGGLYILAAVVHKVHVRLGRCMHRCHRGLEKDSFGLARAVE